MEFVETSIFTQRIIALLTDVRYTKLQAMLVGNPKAGKVIPGTGGLRKVRWRAAGRGSEHPTLEQRSSREWPCSPNGAQGFRRAPTVNRSTVSCFELSLTR